MSLYIDLTELLNVPMTTGIQRISGELCKHMPEGLMTPVRLHNQRYVQLPPTLIQAIVGYFNDASPASLSAMCKLASIENRPNIHATEHDVILVPELFAGERAAFYAQMDPAELSRCRFIIYDLLPLTHPEYFPGFVPLSLIAYYQIVRRATSCAFISSQTRDVFCERFKRTPHKEGSVLSLGSDSLSAGVRQPALHRKLEFSVLGTIEPRKNHALILEAFEPLLRQIPGLTLSFLGKVGWVDSKFSRRVHELASDPDSGFKLYQKPGDDVIRTHMERSRATIYVSAAEGYGLPPVESLWLGTPVIASSTIPSLTAMGSAGIAYVDPLNVVNLRKAVLAFLDDEYANRKINEIATLQLPTWRTFSAEVREWCASTATLQASA